MRRMLFITVAAGLVMALALPAQAKVAGTATISGPGIPGGSITLDGSDGGGWAAFSGLLDVGAAGSEAPPTEALGPRYLVVLDVRQPAQAQDVVQHLYPYARGGAVLYTPPGQRILDFDAPSGWTAASPKLMDLIGDAGLPDQAPQPAAPQPTVPRAEPAGSIPPVAWATVAVGGLLLAAAVTGRRRSRAAAAR